MIRYEKNGFWTSQNDEDTDSGRATLARMTGKVTGKFIENCKLKIV